MTWTDPRKTARPADTGAGWCPPELAERIARLAAGATPPPAERDPATPAPTPIVPPIERITGRRGEVLFVRADPDPDDPPGTIRWRPPKRLEAGDA